jgi:hypothetical protein
VELLERAGFAGRVVDYTIFGFSMQHEASRPQIARLEELSDAYHLRVGERDLMVAYLLEIMSKGSEQMRGMAAHARDGDLLLVPNAVPRERTP